MILDRELQRTLLDKLAEAYPEELNIVPLGLPEPAASANLKYLEDHGLVRLLAKIDRMVGESYHVFTAAITAKGLDFLADDGGLSAILDTVTVRLHADTLRELVAARIDASDLPAEEKARTINLLRELPAEAMKHLTKRFLDAALDQWPAGILLLQKWL